MSKANAYLRGEAFSARCRQFNRPLFIIAHQDDELFYAGLINRLGPSTRFVWVTNGDGLYYEADVSPEEYAEIRKAEAIRAVGTLGVPSRNARCLDFSEVEIYRRMSEMHAGTKTAKDQKPFFQKIRDAVKKAVFEIEPDVVFTCAYQGGHPEHDLSHFFTRLAIDDYRAKTGRNVEFFHLPEYEYTILVAMRFHPLYRGTRMRIRLTSEEIQKKWEMVRAYPSQVDLFDGFRKVFSAVGLLGYLTGGPKSAEEFFSIEEFGPVPMGLSYTRPPHLFDYFSYMFDDFKGTPVTFKGSILPVVKAFLP